MSKVGCKKLKLPNVKPNSPPATLVGSLDITLMAPPTARRPAAVKDCGRPLQHFNPFDVGERVAVSWIIVDRQPVEPLLGRKAAYGRRVVGRGLQAVGRLHTADVAQCFVDRQRVLIFEDRLGMTWIDCGICSMGVAVFVDDIAVNAR